MLSNCFFIYCNQWKENNNISHYCKRVALCRSFFAMQDSGFEVQPYVTASLLYKIVVSNLVPPLMTSTV